MVSQLKDNVSSVKQYNNILRQLKEKGTPKSFSHPKFDWHVNIGFSTHRGFSLLSAYYPEQGCRERSTKFEVRRCLLKLYLAARPHLGDISNSNLAGRRKSRWGLAAEYRSKWRQRCRILGPLETNFIRKTSTSEAKTSVSS